MKKTLLGFVLLLTSSALFAADGTHSYLIGTRHAARDTVSRIARDDADFEGRHNVRAFDIVNAFSANLTEAEAAALQASPEVEHIEFDLPRYALRTGFRTVTVGPSRDPVAAETPLELIPESTFDQVPHPFGIVVPGGGIRTIAAMGDEALLGYLGAAVIESVQLERGFLRRARLMHFDVIR